MENTLTVQIPNSDQSSIKIDLTMVESRFKRGEPYVKVKDTLGVEVRENTYNKGGIGSEPKYIANISKKDQFTYVGTLNEVLKRSGLGVNKYKCGDTYFGNWQEDKKSNYGVYAHKPENDLSEFYAGQWKNAVRNGFGVYVWKKDNQPQDKAIIDVFVGNFIDGAISRGLYVSRQPDGDNVKSYVYFGSFNKAGKKFDENALYYLSSSDILFQGKIEDDSLLKGNIYEGNNKRAFHFVKDENTNQYYPDEVSKTVENSVKDIYTVFKDFAADENIKMALSGLVNKINELIKTHSNLDYFSKEELIFSKELSLDFYQDMFKKFDQLNNKSSNSNEINNASQESGNQEAQGEIQIPQQNEADNSEESSSNL